MGLAGDQFVTNSDDVWLRSENLNHVSSTNTIHSSPFHREKPKIVRAFEIDDDPILFFQLFYEAVIQIRCFFIFSQDRRIVVRK